ncbi:alpha/beta fold hydrolase [Geitlerinema sp. PCC 9228]|jgi:hypothetical protein|uniref:alpha/beta hydrolase n=1 Tax=Geitlerinema sp. PCC 9228 TaxID=111611 RepID=UPI0008F9CDCE|nr:alpha/beta fold hydrolase [Geitlerinema sp. PCC 9228]
MAISLTQVLVLLLLVVVAYVSTGMYLWVQQRRLIFYPKRAIATTPAKANMEYKQVWLPVATPVKANSTVDSQQIYGWWIPNSQNPAPTILYLHGNGGNIGDRVDVLRRFHQMGFAVFAIDYRGYGRSPGDFPSETTVYEDAEAAWKYLLQEKNIPPQKIAIYGHSLGGAIAIELAIRHPQMKGIIVEGTFTSIRDTINYQGFFYQLFPVDWMLTQHFDSLSKVSQLKVPILYIHGEQDDVIPAHMSQTLYDATPQPKQILKIAQADHINVPEVGGSTYENKIRQFLK